MKIVHFTNIFHFISLFNYKKSIFATNYIEMKKILFILSFACLTLTGQAQSANLQKTVEEGIKTSIQQTENREWKEAFATCRQMDALIYADEQKNKKPAPQLHYLVTKERLRMYMRLNKNDQCLKQLEQLKAYANQAKNDALQEDLLMSQAGYYQKFGMTEKSLQCYKQLVQKRSTGKDEKGIDQCYQDMLKQAKQGNNATLTNALNKLYTHWQDSIKAVKAAQKLQALQNDYTASQNTLKEKEDKIGTQQSIIIILCIAAAALAGGLLFFFGLMVKNIAQIKKLKKSLAIANNNNEQKSKLIYSIGEQISPSLEAIESTSSASQKKHTEALKCFLQHIHQYMELEASREERYEVKELNINTLCEIIMNKAKETFAPEVTPTLNVPRVNIRTNAEALEKVLLYLLGNAALNTESGKITLEFKKRSAHTGQFIITDTGTGIPEEKRSNLFKPFTEVLDLTEGDGLGLPTCSLIAYKLNGTLRLDEEYKKGTRFVLELHS